jgi:hypothetical protein
MSNQRLQHLAQQLIVPLPANRRGALEEGRCCQFLVVRSRSCQITTFSLLISSGFVVMMATKTLYPSEFILEGNDGVAIKKQPLTFICSSHRKAGED